MYSSVKYSYKSLDIQIPYPFTLSSWALNFDPIYTLCKNADLSYDIMLQKNKQRAFSRSSIVTLLYQMFVNENNFFQKVLDTSILIQLVFSGMFFTFLSFSRQFFANSLSNLLHDFWKDCFHRAKLLLAVNRLIYLNQEC